MHRLFGILFLVVTVCTCGWPYGLAVQPRPAGELVWAMRVTIAPSWFDPADERVMFAPVYDLRGLMGVGYRVAEHMMNSVPLHPSIMLDDIRRREP